MITIITYLLVASVILFFEVIFPIGIMAVAALAFYLLAVWQGWMHYGLTGGLTTFVVALIMAGITVYWELKMLPKAGLGKLFMLKEQISGTSIDKPTDGMIGAEGVAITALNPSGRVEIAGHIYEAQSVHGQILDGSRVRVVASGIYGLKVQNIA
jgi:membrane-bound ClpP family serine protease